MMSRDDQGDLPDAILTEAAQWHLRSEDQRDDAMDWDGFMAWLEADPRHRRAFDEIALTADAIDRHRQTLVTIQDEEAPRRQRRGLAGWRWGGIAIAASLAAVIAAPQLLTPRAAVYETGAISRKIALDAGSSVTLAPHSRLTVEGRSRDRLAIAGGALFDIRHDPSRTMTISAGDVSISDIGTRFDVQQHDDAVRIAVAQGQVRIGGESLARPVAVAAGSALTYDPAARSATVGPVAPGDVGSWRDGRLSYDNAPLALVADDLRRYAGVGIEVPTALRSRRFSGTLIVEDGDKALHDLAELMGLRLHGHAGAWRIEQR